MSPKQYLTIENNHKPNSTGSAPADPDKRSMGLYPDPDGEMMVSFEIGTKGVPLKSLIPEKNRGEGFKTFRVADYFGLAQMLLARDEDLAAARNTQSFRSATSDAPAKIELPIDLDHLRLRRADGAMHPERTAQLFEVVQAYWTAPPQMLALEPGLVGQMWRRGMQAQDIIRGIQASTDQNGKLIKPRGRGHDILNTVIDTYLELKGWVKERELPPSEMSDLIERWLRATRSTPLQSKAMTNSALHWSDYRRLGLVDQTGAADPDQVRLLAQQVFQGEETPTFADLLAWVDAHSAPQAYTAQTSSAKAAKSLLKKRRKQGRVNRKRGRR